MEAAFEILRTKGIDAVSMRRLCRILGPITRTAYHTRYES